MLVSDFKNGQITSVNNAEKSLGDIVYLSKQLPGNFPLDPPAALSLVSKDCIDMLLSVSRAPILHLAMVQPMTRYTPTLYSMPGTRYAVHSLPATSCTRDSSLGLVGMQMVVLG